MSKDDTGAARRDAVRQFLELVVAGRIDEAYDLYVDMGGRHHNPYFPAGFPALRQAMIGEEGQHPGKKLFIKHVLVDGDMAAVHSHLVFDPKEPGMTVVHLFRFEGDRIAELWDVGQVLPADSPNTDGAF